MPRSGGHRPDPSGGGFAVVAPALVHAYLHLWPKRGTVSQSRHIAANAATANASNNVARFGNKAHLDPAGNGAGSETNMRHLETLTGGLFAVATIVLAVEAIIAF